MEGQTVGSQRLQDHSLSRLRIDALRSKLFYFEELKLLNPHYLKKKITLDWMEPYAFTH